MNKQDVLDYILEENRTHQKNNSFQRGYRTAMRHVYDRVKQLDEPEKPILTKEEAEWVEGLIAYIKKIGLSKYSSLYYISRQGLGYLFEYKEGLTANSKEIKHVLNPKLYPREIYPDDLKERLLNALLYGYEVEKDKLYTVKFANEDFGKMYIGIFKKFNKLGISSLPLNDDEVKSWFTEDELKRFKFWDNPAFEIKEVKK